MSDSSTPQNDTPPQVITFDQIPSANEWQVPGTYVEVNPNYTQSGLVAYPAKLLIIGQMVVSGAEAGTAAPNGPIPLDSGAQARALFGLGTIAAQMADYFIQANPYLAVDIIGVPGAGGAVKATGGVTIGGAATAAGTLALYLQGVRVPVPVNSGDAAATVASNALATINALAGEDLADLCVTAAAGGAGVVALTAIHGGTLGNTLDIRINYQAGESTPAGLTVTIAPMTGGATDPSIATALSMVATSFYSDIVMCWVDANNVALLEAALVTRYNAMTKLDSHAYGVLDMTYGQALSNQATLNCQYRSVMAVQNAPQPAWMWAASLAGVASFSLADDPSLQLRNLALPGILAPAPGDRFPDTERNLLLESGISTFKVEVDGTVVLEKVVTEYTTSAAGVPDTAYHDIMAPKVASRIRYDWIGYIDLLYPQNKLADDGTVAAEYGPTIVTPNRLKAHWASRSLLYERYGWIENSQATAAQSSFQRDLTDRNRVNSRMQYQRIGNLMVLAASLEFQA